MSPCYIRIRLDWDQVGDGALLIDLADPGSMALHLKELVLKPELREEMIRRPESIENLFR